MAAVLSVATPQPTLTTYGYSVMGGVSVLRMAMTTPYPYVGSITMSFMPSVMKNYSLTCMGWMR